MINYDPFLNQLSQTELADWAQQLPVEIDKGLDEKRYGDLPRWKNALSQLPDMPVGSVNLDNATITIAPRVPIDQQLLEDFRESLKALHPWRKGPFKLFGVSIDTEWRSDLKWNRIRNSIASLHGRNVLDVGCGNGYYAFRMKLAGAASVTGIDPTTLFVCQFLALKKLSGASSVHVLPLRLNELPARSRSFDTTFSMGVLYHQRDPASHLSELRDTLRPGGELVLETLVIPGDLPTVIEPEDRYARMRNVWHLPTVPALESWLQDAGLQNIRLVDFSRTTVDEQRTTPWMPFESLAEALDPDDSSLTIEGLPAPVRAVLTCTVT